MKYIATLFALVASLSFAATPVTDLKLYGNANANTNRITNATDFVSASGVSLTNLAASSTSGAITGNQYNAILGGLTISNALTVGGALNANDNVEVASGKHVRFQDGNGTNRITLDGLDGRLIVSGAVDIVTTKTNPLTINGVAVSTSGGGGSGTLTGVVVGAGSSTRLTATNSGSANATINFDAVGLATGTPVYVETDSGTNVTARLASNVWAAADSTTNYAARTGNNVLLGSNVISGLSISTNTSGQVKLNLIDGAGQDTLALHAGGFRTSGFQPAVGARLTLQGTNAGGSVTLSTVGSGAMSLVGGGGIALTSTNVTVQGITIVNGSVSNVGHILATGLLKTAGSEQLYAPLYVGAVNIVTSNSNPNSGAINSMPTYFDVRAWADPTIRHYINTTNMDEFPRYASEFWNFANISSNFPAEFGVGIRMGPHSATSAVYFASVETRASGTNDLDGRLSIQLASSSIGSTTTRREVAYFDSARNMVVSGRVTAASFAGDGSALTGISGGGASLTTNAVIKLQSMRGSWDVSSDIPANGGGAIAFEQPFTTSTVFRASFRTISTSAVSRVIQGAYVALSSVETNWLWFDIDHIGTNAATIQFTAAGATNVLFSQNLTTTGVYRISGTNAAGNRELVPYLYTTNTGPGTTNFSRTWIPVIKAVVQ